MNRLLSLFSGGSPELLPRPIGAAFLEGLCRIFQAGLVFLVVQEIYRSYALPDHPLDLPLLWKLAAALGVWTVVQYGISLRAYDATFTAAYEASARGRIALGDHLRRLSLGYLNSRDPGDLTTMLLEDYAQLETAMSHYLPQLVSALAFPVLFCLGLSFWDWRLALALFAGLPVGCAFIFASRRLQDWLGRAHVAAKIDASSRMQEYLNNMREIKAHNLGGAKFQRLERAFRSLKREAIRLEGIVGPLVMVGIAATRTGLSLVVLLGVYRLVGGRLDPLVFTGFLLLGGRVFDPITLVLTNYAEIRYSLLSGQRILELRRQPIPQGKGEPPREGSIEFRNVTFAYGDTPVLSRVNLSIPSRSVTALVGPSGCGKSTVARLIARFWDVRDGAVLLEGRNVKDLDPDRLLSRISMVFQDVYLFRDTIGNNIRVGNPEATQEQVEEAARRARCHEFIQALPQGYDTRVGEGGCTLSGGERQRVSIARALLKDAPIVLLDEATSSLDPENEQAVQEALQALVEDRTVVVIAHRLKTVRHADRIVVLDQGKVAGWGTHEELLEREPLYQKLWGLQQQAERWELGATA
ncbi:ABC transporter ATP-binding protein [Aminomonas paucivorans]|uniref:ABC transporter ATP-binding protein n=1 Tax=Aminomonas paucivorans TaxID=81412 RepID=UPI00331EAA7E